MNLELYDDMSKLFEPHILVCSRDKKLIVKVDNMLKNICRQNVETLRQGWIKCEKWY